VALEARTLGPLTVLAEGQGDPLMYLGGLLPVAGVDSRLVIRAAEYSLRPFGARLSLYTNRRSGMRPGTTMAEIAAEHAEAIAALDAGPVDVIGASTGGSIAQELAVNHPDVVRRLVLVSTGCRLLPNVRRVQRRVAADVRRGRPSRALASLALGLVAPRTQPLARVLAPFLSRAVRGLGDLSDLAATIEAEDGFDLARTKSRITAPTLIVGGERDRFYPPVLLEETRRLIPRSRLVIIPKRGHLTTTADARTIAAIRDFLF
jgi:pimeloyl-ACP methyl ester carboxylesterase